VTELVAAAQELAVDNVRQAGGDATQVVIEVQVAELLTIEVARHLIVMALANVLKVEFVGPSKSGFYRLTR
jgi:hypothetical protein